MKLKYKLFTSYLILIIFISIALFVLILQLKAMDQFIKLRIEQDLQEVVLLSHQQQLLEDVYAQYILLRISGQSRARYELSLESAIEDYNRNWDDYILLNTNVSDLTYFPLLDQIVRGRLVDSEQEQIKSDEKYAVEKQCEEFWSSSEKQLRTMLRNLSYTGADIKESTRNLRENLILLAELIAQHTHQSGAKMHAVASKINFIVLIFVLAMVVISLLIAFFVARIFSRPLEELKTGIEQIAIQNFDVKIPNKSHDEIGDLASAFEQMAFRLKQNESFKTEMLGQFTHEMKSPLIAIEQALQLLEKTIGENQTVDQKRLLSIINGNNETLGNLITNILHSATYQADKMQLVKRTENIIKLFTNTLMKIAPTIKDKNLKVDLNFSSEKIECEIEKDRIEEVFYNLLSNAVKFSPQGSTLQVLIIDQNDNIQLSIRDRGIGIPSKEIPYIFEKMYRASNSRKISVKGTGLGLYITSQIVKAHGGKIKVKSKENVGTEFTVLLPKSNESAEVSGK